MNGIYIFKKNGKWYLNVDGIAWLGKLYDSYQLAIEARQDLLALHEYYSQ